MKVVDLQLTIRVYGVIQPKAYRPGANKVVRYINTVWHKDD